MTTPADAVLPAPATGGLSALDRDRAGSLANEGGASASTIEAPHALEAGEMRSARPLGWRFLTIAGLLTGACAVLLARRGRPEGA